MYKATEEIWVYRPEIYSFNVSLNLHYKLQKVTILIWKNILDSK